MKWSKTQGSYTKIVFVLLSFSSAFAHTSHSFSFVSSSLASLYSISGRRILRIRQENVSKGKKKCRPRLLFWFAWGQTPGGVWAWGIFLLSLPPIFSYIEMKSSDKLWPMDGCRKITAAILSVLLFQLTILAWEECSKTLGDFEILLTITVYFFSSFSFRIISFLLRECFFPSRPTTMHSQILSSMRFALNEEKRNLRLFSSYSLCSVVIFCAFTFNLLQTSVFIFSCSISILRRLTSDNFSPVSRGNYQISESLEGKDTITGSFSSDSSGGSFSLSYFEMKDACNKLREDP